MKKPFPIVTYYNVEEYKYIIYKDNKNISGIYRWNNKITGKSYIGSSINLTKRLRAYFSVKVLTNKLSRSKSEINSALLKDGYSNFTLDILEYCDQDSVLRREQYYIDTLIPEYNILKKAGSRLGFQHSENVNKDKTLFSKKIN